MSRSSETSAVNILDENDVTISPATEETLTDVLEAIDSLGGNATGLTASRIVIAVTDTAIALGNAACKTIWVTSLTTNSDVIVLGGSGVIHTLANRTGSVMYPGDKLEIAIDDINKVFINGVADDGVSFSYST